jgi:hypothetical protein
VLDAGHARIIAHTVAEHRDVVREHPDGVVLGNAGEYSEHRLAFAHCIQERLLKARGIEIDARRLDELVGKGA